MKVLALVIVTIASVSSLGSGPYLPSGWRPQGPAFYLPSEVQKPSENPLKDTIFQESEASGSDALREYGPPKVSEVSQDLTSQSLPDAVTEQAFVAIAKVAEEVGEVREVSEVAEVAEEVKEAVTEAVEAVEVAEEKSTEAVTEAVEEKTTAALESAFEGRALDVAIEETQEATTEAAEATTGAVSVEVTEAAVAEVVDSNVESTQVEQVSQVQEVSQAQEVSQVQEVGQVQEVSQVAVEVAQVRTAEEGVKEVAEALVNLENEIKAQQVQNEEAVEVKSVQVLGQAEVPEGFLEYGPPGFREYGPPQADELLRSGAIQESTEEENKVENNETRRRRFSPKFRSSKKH